MSAYFALVLVVPENVPNISSKFQAFWHVASGTLLLACRAQPGDVVACGSGTRTLRVARMLRLCVVAVVDGATNTTVCNNGV